MVLQQRQQEPFDPTATVCLDAGRIAAEWFKGGITNICYNALDRHVAAGKGDVPCFLWEGNDIRQDQKWTYQQVLDEVCRLANWLKSVGVRKGDAVSIYMPMLAELPIAMLACARIGAVHSVVFGGFSAEALGGRMADCKAKVLITTSGVMRGAKRIDLKKVRYGRFTAGLQRGSWYCFCA